MKRIDALQLDINSDTVAQAIVKTPKIKLKHQVSSDQVSVDDLMDRNSFVSSDSIRFAYGYEIETELLRPWLGLQNIRIVDRDKLFVLPPDQDKGKLYFYLHSLCNALPKVIVKVLCAMTVGVD